MEIGRRLGKFHPENHHKTTIYFKCYCDYEAETILDNQFDLLMMIQEHISAKHDIQEISRMIAEDLLSKEFSNSITKNLYIKN